MTRYNINLEVPRPVELETPVRVQLHTPPYPATSRKDLEAHSIQPFVHIAPARYGRPHQLLQDYPYTLFDTRVLCQRERGLSPRRTAANLTGGMSTGCPAMNSRYEGAPERGGQSGIKMPPVAGGQAGPNRGQVELMSCKIQHPLGFLQVKRYLLLPIYH